LVSITTDPLHVPFGHALRLEPSPTQRSCILTQRILDV
jgi:hypothetical protein